MPAPTKKAIAFGVLNVGERTVDRLTVTAVVPDQRFDELNTSFPNFLADRETNHMRFEQLAAASAVQRLFACGRYRLGVPENLFYALGARASDLDVTAAPCACSPARKMIERFGPRSQFEVEALYPNAGHTSTRELRPIEVPMDERQLVEVTLGVELEARTVFALHVQHLNRAGNQVGEVSLLFKPAVEIG